MRCHPDTVFSLPWSIRGLAFRIHFHSFLPFSVLREKKLLDKKVLLWVKINREPLVLLFLAFATLRCQLYLQQRGGCLSSTMQTLQPYSTGLICRELRTAWGRTFAWYRIQFVKTAFLDHNTSQDRTRAKALCPCGESKEGASSRRRWVPLPLMHSKQVHKLPHVFQGLTWPFSSRWLAVSSPTETGVPWFDCIKNKHSLRIECLQN